MVLEKVAEKLGVNIEKEKYKGLIGEFNYCGEKVILVKPTTFMNLSGDCVTEILNFYKVSTQDLIVVYDDIDISVGKIRVRPSGSPGTHNGMRDITAKLGSSDFARIRVGAGKPQIGNDLVSHVLGMFLKEEIPEILKAIENASEAIIEILNKGVYSAMNKYN